MYKSISIAVAFCLLSGTAYAAKPDHASGKRLPPGLQKKMERGGALPPGWEKKLRKGSVLDSQVYRASKPLDDRLRVKLPVGPNGTVDLQIEGKVVRIYKATRIIQAVFNSP